MSNFKRSKHVTVNQKQRPSDYRKALLADIVSSSSSSLLSASATLSASTTSSGSVAHRKVPLRAPVNIPIKEGHYYIDTNAQVFNHKGQALVLSTKCVTPTYSLLLENRTTKYIHVKRLMAATFFQELINTENIMFYHKDGDVSNNKLENLGVVHAVDLNTRRMQPTLKYTISINGRTYNNYDKDITETLFKHRNINVESAAVTLVVRKIYRTYPIDELMVDNFCDGIANPTGYIIHIDGDHRNNKLENICYIPEESYIQKLIIKLQSTHSCEKFKVVGTIIRNGNPIDFGYRYLVSSEGRVFSCHNMDFSTLQPNEEGYLKAALLTEGQMCTENGYSIYVHNIVAQVFIGPRLSSDYHIDHINQDKKDNSKDNLRYLLAKDNSFRRRSKGLPGSSGFSSGVYTHHPLDDDPSNWKKLPVIDGVDFSNYKVSTSGNVKNVKSDKYLAYRIKTTGYMAVQLHGDQGSTSRIIGAHLVATAFCERPFKEYDTVDHINGDKQNNKAVNLRWCTQQQNSSFANGTPIKITNINNENETQTYNCVARAQADIIGATLTYHLKSKNNVQLDNIIWKGKRMTILVEKLLKTLS